MEPLPSKCLVCLKDMPSGAEKCTECDSYQDYRRHVFAWSGLIGALIAMYPLWQGSWSVAELAFPSPSKISLAEFQCEPQKMSYIVLNSGGQTAYIYSPRFELQQADEQAIELELQIPDSASGRISANDLRPMTVPMGAGQTLPEGQAGQKCVITLVQKSIDATTQTAATTRASCQCPN